VVCGVRKDEMRMVKAKNRLGITLIIIGILLIFFPVLIWVYGYYSQWTLHREWIRSGGTAKAPVVEGFAWAAPANQQKAATQKNTPAKQAKPAQRQTTRPANPSQRQAARPANPQKARPAQKAGQQKTGATNLVRLEIPKIGVKAIVVNSTNPAQLAKGPGHIEGTGRVGEPGNYAVAAHRNLRPFAFGNLYKLAPGDKIIARTPSKTFVYRVISKRTVSATDWSAVARTTDPTITLLTCTKDPKVRLIVTGKLEQG
jgi:sortase A